MILLSEEQLEQLLKEQRELCANRFMKDQADHAYKRFDCRISICSAPTPDWQRFFEDENELGTSSAER